MEDALVHRTTLLYDAPGRPVAQINALGHRVTLVYDAAGQAVALVNPNSERTTFHYDPRGQLSARQDPLGRRTTYVYDAAGQAIERRDPRGILTTYLYDLDGRQVGSRSSVDPPVTFAYDRTGNRTLSENALGRTTTTYDPRGQVRSVVDPTGKRITYTYDTVGRRARMTAPDDGRFTYAHDLAGSVLHLVNPFQQRTTWTYNALAQELTQQLANTSLACRTYDDAGRLTSLANQQNDGTVISRFTYTYDAAGNRTRVLEANGSRSTWTYDASYQLASEHRTGATAFRITHMYDPAGNRLLQVRDGARTTYAYQADQLRRSEDLSGVTTYSYDAAGNLAITTNPANQVTTNTWDAEDRLTRVALRTGVLNTMAYNPDGLRVRKDDSAGAINFVWDEQNILLETGASGNVNVVYTLAPEQYGKLVSQSRASGDRFYHLDALDSAAQLTDNDQKVTDTYTYEAYGQIAAMTGTSTNPFRFVGALGYYHDADPAIYYVRARHYDPRLTRWLSEDSVSYGTHDVNPPELQTGEAAYHAIEWTSESWDGSTEDQQGVVGPNGGTRAILLNQNQSRISPGDTNLYRYVRNRSTTARDPAGLDITLETGNDSWSPVNNLLHQQVCVEDDCFRKTCFSFAMTGPQLPQFSSTWLGWSSLVVGAILRGQIYERGPVVGATVDGRHRTTAGQALKWLFYMLHRRVGTGDAYSIARHNCRTYSQWEFRDAPVHW